MSLCTEEIENSSLKPLVTTLSNLLSTKLSGTTDAFFQAWSWLQEEHRKCLIKWELEEWSQYSSHFEKSAFSYDYSLLLLFWQWHYIFWGCQIMSGLRRPVQPRTCGSCSYVLFFWWIKSYRVQYVSEIIYFTKLESCIPTISYNIQTQGNIVLTVTSQHLFNCSEITAPCIILKNKGIIQK